jgi:hypothetical protein
LLKTKEKKRKKQKNTKNCHVAVEKSMYSNYASLVGKSSGKNEIMLRDNVTLLTFL